MLLFKAAAKAKAEAEAMDKIVKEKFGSPKVNTERSSLCN